MDTGPEVESSLDVDQLDPDKTVAWTSLTRGNTMGQASCRCEQRGCQFGMIGTSIDLN